LRGGKGRHQEEDRRTGGERLERERERRDGLLCSGGAEASRLAVVGSDTAVIDLACPFPWLSFRILKFGDQKSEPLPAIRDL
jgi:hypothetical protein